MKEQALSIEQMQHLKELGVDTSKASMVLIYTDDEDNILDWEEVQDTFEHPEVFEHFYDAETGNYDHSYRKDCGVFTLQDIIDLLPKMITTNDFHRDRVRFVADFSENKIGYAYSHETCGEISFYKEFCWVDKIINAAYEMLCWYIKNNINSDIWKK